MTCYKIRQSFLKKIKIKEKEKDTHFNVLYLLVFFCKRIYLLDCYHNFFLCIPSTILRAYHHTTTFLLACLPFLIPTAPPINLL